MPIGGGLLCSNKDVFDKLSFFFHLPFNDGEMGFADEVVEEYEKGNNHENNQDGEGQDYLISYFFRHMRSVYRCISYCRVSSNGIWAISLLRKGIIPLFHSQHLRRSK